MESVLRNQLMRQETLSRSVLLVKTPELEVLIENVEP